MLGLAKKEAVLGFFFSATYKSKQPSADKWKEPK